MRLRHFLGVAIFCGAVGTLGGQTVQAQAPSSPKFVKLLLTKEGTLIKSDTKALNTRDADIAKLNGTSNQRKINQLNKSLNKLHSQILSMTTRLITLSGQVYTDAKNVSPTNTTLVSKAFSNLVTVQTLAVRAGLGLNPATPSQ